ncbi:hypothetical protein BGC07_07300 [Piscirickettsia litoralis]|uniref:Uncharacterized protein n=1 Tax=Piscirickettsia litoralis TaxID=1891921 RepID=A0ABX3A2N6_9GAMM|nr:hypothetical protein BGC07_07300 [Piscirickettsia litoralis]
MQKISNILTQAIADFGFQLNPTKTIQSSDIICSSIKSDKLNYIRYNHCKPLEGDLDNQLLFIKMFSNDFPSSGKVKALLSNILTQIEENNALYNDPILTISIITDIISRCPSNYPVGTAILSHLLNDFNNISKQKEIAKKYIKNSLAHH